MDKPSILSPKTPLSNLIIEWRINVLIKPTHNMDAIFLEIHMKTYSFWNYFKHLQYLQEFVKIQLKLWYMKLTRFYLTVLSVYNLYSIFKHRFLKMLKLWLCFYLYKSLSIKLTIISWLENKSWWKMLIEEIILWN